MRKLSLRFLLMTGLLVSFFVACDDDDDGPDIAPPTISASDNATVTVGETTDVTFTVNAPGGFASASVAPNDAAIATTADPTGGTVGEQNNTLTVTVTGVAAGETNITLTVEDQQGQQATDDVTITVEEDGGGENPEPPTTEITTVADTVATIDSLSTLTAALDAVDLVEALDNEDASFTVFAPVNAAFDSLLSEQNVETLEDLVAAITAEGVSGILQAHVVADSLPADLLTDPEYPTLNEGSTITITTEGENVFANGAQVIAPNIIAGNGVIHIIDSVINVDASPAVEEEEGTVRVVSSEEGVGTTTWTANNTYILDGFVYVNDGQTLTIEPGTVIKGRPGQAARASALIVARGGTLNANGTAENPIIFTAEADDLNGSVADDAAGLWGGVIVLGNAPNNNNDVSGVKNIEGIPTEEERGAYGGTVADDNSGTMTYVSIRHGGSVIGANNEINGLTLGAVGSGTTINNIEVWSNLDDGIEFFGGTVNASNLVVAYCGDDGLDADEGYSGNVQNAIVWHTSGTLRSSDPRGMELDGGVDVNENAEPYSTPIFANLTLVYDDADNDMEDAFVIRDNSAASIYNSIIANHDAAAAIERRTDLDEGEGENAVGGSSYDRYEDGTLVISGNIFSNVNGVTSADNFGDIVNIDTEEDEELESGLDAALAEVNTVADPTFGTGTSKFTPTADAVTAELAELPQEGGLTTVTYKGAVDPDAASPYFANWSKTWAVLGQ